ncbi:long-chain fatty acid--CoA ligase [Leifsonia kafniensis]|uniref:Long-chain fatty acid--CoA ligase n=1 Tax=Leifsonia kafniensis TaxID=475957 RepID=A0ABP7KSQ7_9MICO
MDCGQIVGKFARYRPDSAAVIFGGTTLTSRELLERSFRLANGLAALGIRRGDTVATLGVNALRSVEEITGLAIGGYIRVPLHQGNDAESHRYMLENSRARVLITDATGLAECGDALISLEHLEAIIVDDVDAHLRYADVIAAADPSDPGLAFTQDDILQIGYTGGTTGRPKGAVQTHGSWLDVTTDNMTLLPPSAGAGDLFVVGGPVAGGASTYLYSCFAKGIGIVVAPDRKASTAARLIQEHRASILMALPPLVQGLVDDTGIDGFNLSSLRSIISAGAPLSSRVIRSVTERFGPVLTFVYGQSECVPIAALTPDLIAAGIAAEPELLQSVGRPTVRSAIRIVGPDGNELPAGETGEITADAAGTMHSYWDDPQGTAAKLTADGFVRTGDLGHTSEDGVLFLSDRVEDIIRYGDTTVTPSFLEDAFSDHPAVHEVVVIGVPDKKLGQLPHAVLSVTPGSGIREDDIRVWWAGRTSAQDVPVSVQLSPTPLPRTPAGKLSRRLIREQFLPAPRPPRTQ